MEIHVISLKQSQDRKNEFDKHNSHVQYHYHEAVDGKTITPVQILLNLDVIMKKVSLVVPFLIYNYGINVLK
jgi:GR25 family glycosyltransferase involved in LPS biosynthesis